MRNVGTHLKCEAATIGFNPSPDLVVLAWRMVIRGAQDDLAECFAHDEMEKCDGLNERKLGTKKVERN